MQQALSLRQRNSRQIWVAKAGLSRKALPEIRHQVTRFTKRLTKYRRIMLQGDELSVDCPTLAMLRQGTGGRMAGKTKPKQLGGRKIRRYQTGIAKIWPVKRVKHDQRLQTLVPMFCKATEIGVEIRCLGVKSCIPRHDLG